MTDNGIKILDTSCLLGVHRLLKVISEPFEKLVLPPDVDILAWPSEMENAEFAMMTAVARKVNDVW